MADAVNPSGAITQVLDPGKILTVSTGAGASGSVAVFNGTTLEASDRIAANSNEVYGPYATQRTLRLYPQVGSLGYKIEASVSAIPALGAAVVSQDGKTISGVGVKPSTQVLVYNVDTGASIGTTQSLVDGSWSVKLNAALASGVRVGYDATIVGPVTTVGAVLDVPGQPAAPTLGAATATTQMVNWAAPSTGGAPDDYALEYRQQGTSAWTDFPVTGTGTSATVTGLTASTSYQYRVTASNASGPGQPSAVTTGSTAAPPSTSTPGQITTDLSDGSNIGPKV